MGKRRGLKIFLFIAVVLTFALAVYFAFFFSYKCDDLACFNTHQEKCKRTKFVKDGPEIKWDYHIKGKNGDQCDIKVGIIQVKKGPLKVGKLEGESMICSLPLGKTIPPESEINLCHGLLKESLQDLAIQNLHSYILSNLGEINEELEKIV